MINRTLALTAAALLAILSGGCKSPEAQLEGKWKFSDIKIPANSPGANQLDAARQQLGSTTAEFKHDKSFVLMAGKAVEGTWTITGHAISMKITKADGKDIASIKAQIKATIQQFAKTNAAVAKQLEQQETAIDQPITANLSDDGKTLTLQPSAGKQGEILFVKQ